MLRRKHSPWLRYGIAFGAVALALALTFLMQERDEANIFALFLAGVMLSAWFGGLGPGLFATILGGIIIDYLFIVPLSLDFDAGHFQRLGVYGLVAILISSLTAARKRSEEALSRAHDELESRVKERTAELAETNQKLQFEISERKEAERRVGRVAEELADRNRELLRLQAEMGRVERLAALGRITATIAHELGTPLNSVLGHAQLLAHEGLSESAHRRLNVIKGQIERMVEIINRHLSWARGSFQSRVQVDVNHMIRETLELFKPVFQQHGVEVSVTLSEQLPPIWADEASLQRVLINILDNAVDAMERGGKLTVATRASKSSERTGSGLIIEVTDSGVGIAPEMLPKIFDFFVTTKPPGKGTGLGLGVCQEIVKGHGGTIEISSWVGEGTSARVFLPAGDEVMQSVAAEGIA